MQMFLLIGSLLVAFAMFPIRRMTWAPVIWLPAMCVTLRGLTHLLRVASAHSGQGMEALGTMFALLAAIPFAVVLLVLLFTFPRKWQLIPAAAGMLLTVALFVSTHWISTVPVTVEILGPRGTPLSGLRFAGGEVRDGIGSSTFNLITDAEGRFHFRHNPQTSMTLEMAETSDFSPVSISFSSQPGYTGPNAPPPILSGNIGWKLAKEFHQTTTVSIRPNEVLRVFVKPRYLIVSEPLQAAIAIRISLIQSGTPTAFESLSSLCQNTESLALIPQLADLLNIQPAPPPGTIKAMIVIAETLKNLSNFEKRIRREKDPAGNRLHAALCAWAGADPALADSINAVSAKFQSIADDLIAASRPRWSDENTSVGVVQSLGPLGWRAYADFAEVYSTAHPRAQRSIRFALERSHASAEAVQWALDSNDPELIAAAYNGVSEKLNPAQLAIAIERLEKINHPSTNTRAQMHVEVLLPQFKARIAPFPAQ